MATDPNIILQAGNIQQPDPNNILKLLDFAQQYKANQMQIAQQQRAVQQQNAAQAVYSDPSNYDASGTLNTNALISLGKISPDYYNKGLAGQSEAAQRAAETEARTNAAAKGEQDWAAGMVNDHLVRYDDALKNAAPQSVPQITNDLMTGIHDDIYARKDLSKPQADALWSKYAGMSPIGLRRLAMTSEVRGQVQAREEELAAESPHDFVDGAKRNLTQMGDGSFVLSGTDQKVTPIGQLTSVAPGFNAQALAARTAAAKDLITTRANSGAPLDQDTLDFAAQQVLDGNPLPALGMGASQTRVAILKRAAELGAQDSGSARAAGGDAIERHADIKSTGAALTSIEKQRASVGQFAPTALGLADKIEGLMGKATTQYGPEWVAKALQSFKTGQLGDATTREFRTYIADLQSENAKIMAGATGSVAQVSSSNQDKMDEILNGSMPASEVSGALKAIRSGIQLRQQSLDTEATSLRQQLHGEATPGRGSPGGDAAPAGQIAKPTSKADYDALPKGAHYSKPGDPPGTYRVKS